MLEIGQKAPSFKLKNQHGEEQALKDFKGKKVIIYFYPRDMTPGCTTEACDFRDHHSLFNKKKSVVFGISKDSVARHAKFMEKYELPFDLLSDEDGSVCKAYDVIHEKNMYGKKVLGIVRSTFLINELGIIEKIWWKVKVSGHAEEVLADL
jgi:peroxiredoxin Q/BCP